MTLADRLDLAKRMVDAGVIRDGDGLVAALRAMEPTQTVTPIPNAFCMASEYQKGTCVFLHGHAGRHSYEVGSALGGKIRTYAMPKGLHTNVEALQQELARKGEGIGIVTPPLSPKPCPTLGCTFVNGHNAPCNIQDVPPEETKPPARAHLKGCVLDKAHEGKCFVVWATRPCPYAAFGCGETHLCSPCRGERIQGTSLTKSLRVNIPGDPLVDIPRVFVVKVDECPIAVTSNGLMRYQRETGFWDDLDANPLEKALAAEVARFHAQQKPARPTLRSALSAFVATLRARSGPGVTVTLEVSDAAFRTIERDLSHGMRYDRMPGENYALRVETGSGPVHIRRPSAPKEMLLDGVAPTPAQVAHIRSEALGKILAFAKERAEFAARQDAGNPEHMAYWHGGEATANVIAMRIRELMGDIK